MSKNASLILYALHSQSPWSTEMYGHQGQVYPGEMSCTRQNDMTTVIIRLAERLLDSFQGLLKIQKDEGPSKIQLASALGAILPALYDILNTVDQTSDGNECGTDKKVLYMHKLIKVR